MTGADVASTAAKGLPRAGPLCGRGPSLHSVRPHGQVRRPERAERDPRGRARGARTRGSRGRHPAQSPGARLERDLQADGALARRGADALDARAPARRGPARGEDVMNEVAEVLDSYLRALEAG